MRRGGSHLVRALCAMLPVLASASPMPRVVRPPTRLADSVRIPVLVYHNVAPHHPGQTRAQREFDVDPGVFEQQMRLLGEHGYAVLSLDQLADVLLGQASAPERAVAVTFDDGWAAQYRHAFPVLRRLGLTATFFVVTAPIGHDEHFMTWDQLREMQLAGMTIGSHSRTHQMLTRDQDALDQEVQGSRDDLARELGTRPAFFAYPFGNLDARVIAAVRDAGYRGARRFGGGPWNGAATLWALRSVEVTDDMAAFRQVLRIPDAAREARP